jgi:hypothetical protein
VSFIVMHSFHQGRYDDGATPLCVHIDEAEAEACAERAALARGFWNDDGIWRLHKLSSDQYISVTEAEDHFVTKEHSSHAPSRTKTPPGASAPGG